MTFHFIYSNNEQLAVNKRNDNVVLISFRLYQMKEFGWIVSQCHKIYKLRSFTDHAIRHCAIT